MGTYNKGILGPFSGKVGTVVGANWRGKDIMRSLPKKTARTPTDIQLLQRRKFTFVSDFLTPLAQVISRFYGTGSGTTTRRNNAMSYHMKEAVVYNNPDFALLYNKVLLCKGELTGLENATVTAAGGNGLRFDWQDNSGEGEAKATDQLVVVVYAPSGKLSYFDLSAAERSDTTVTITLPSSFEGLEVQMWLALASADGAICATSMYLGSITVS